MIPSEPDKSVGHLTDEELHKIEQLCIGAWHVIGHHVPKLFQEIRKLRKEISEIEQRIKK